MTADRKAGQSIGSVFPHLISQVRIPMITVFPLRVDTGTYDELY